MIPTIEIAWAAGFFDGEGTVYAAKASNNRRHARAGIAQVDREPLDRFHAAVGVGTVTGPYRKPWPNQKDQYQWNVQSIGGVRRVYDLLGPILSSRRREQFEHALSIDTR